MLTHCFFVLAAFAAINAAKSTVRYEVEFAKSQPRAVSMLTQLIESPSYTHSVFFKLTKKSGLATIVSCFHKDRTNYMAFDLDKEEVVCVLNKEEKRFKYEVKQDKWIHFALVRNGVNGDVILYFDGKEAKNLKKYQPKYVEDGLVYAVLGQRITDGMEHFEKGYNFEGQMTDFNTYKKVLTPEQIKHLANSKEIDEKKRISWGQNVLHDKVTARKSTLKAHKCPEKDSKEKEEEEEEEQQQHDNKDCPNYFDLVIGEKFEKAQIQVSGKKVEKDITDFSFATWVRVEKENKESTLISYVSGKESIVVFVRAESVYLIHGGTEYRLTKEKVIQPKEWIHVTITHTEKGVTKLYINGELVDTLENVGGGKKIKSGGTVTLGRRQNADSRLIGRLNRVQFSYAVWPEDEIVELSQGHSGYKDKKLVTIVGSCSEYSLIGYIGLTDSSLDISSDDDNDNESPQTEGLEPYE